MLRAVKPATQRGSLLNRAAYRALPKLLRQFSALRDAYLLDEATITPPAPTEATNLWVKRGRVNGHTR